MKQINVEDVEDIVFDGIDFTDHPDYSDAYIESATYKNREMTEYEMEELQNTEDMWVYEKLMDWIF
tara:strand:- start:2306 stop:2503 length:198 start_codon:yes stop_codon:yes gene_type:complete